MPFLTDRRKGQRTEGIGRLMQAKEARNRMLDRILGREQPREQINPYSFYTGIDWTADNYTAAGANVWPSTASDIMQTIYANSTGTANNVTWTYDTTAYSSNLIGYQSPQWWQQRWERSYQPTFSSVYTVNDWAAPVAEPLTQEEADRRLAAARADAHKHKIRRTRAIKKGRRLLLEVMTDEQMVEYAKTRSFTITGADGKKYKLRKGGTTHEINSKGHAVLSHCIHLPYSYVDEDTLVAVKMMLETDPDEFRKIANTSKLSPPTLVHAPGDADPVPPAELWVPLAA